MGAWTELVDFTFTADETSRTFSGLSITEDDFIKIVMTQVNGSSSDSRLTLFPNTAAGVSGFDTSANYHNQLLAGSGTDVIASRGNFNRISFTFGSQTNTKIVYLKMSENGKFNTFTNRLSRNDSNVQVAFDYTTSSNLTFNDPITSLTFTAEQTDGLGDGSRIQIYRLDAEKEADITTTSNQTQVDISSLSIGKDSEYLLVSDILSSTADFADGRLMINDNTTDTNYYSQRILGSGTTTNAARGNNAKYNEFTASNRIMVYTHIKLSEIGAYTYQSYQIQGVGLTTPTFQNWFGSSTAENITSITKLNIKSGTTNAIASGSRFILYKLK